MTTDASRSARSIAGLAFADLLALEGYPDGSDATVYLSGSMVTPFANPWSDVDIYVIGHRHPTGQLTLQDGAARVSQHFLEDRRVDYEFLRPADVDNLSRRLDDLELGAGGHVLRSLFTYSEECFIHRLRVGVPLLNDEGFQTFQSMFDFEKFGRYLSQEVIRESDGFYEDVCGMLEAADYDSAVLNSRKLMGLSVDAYLHAAGNSDPNVKWRARYLKLFDDGSAFHRDMAEHYWRLEFPGDMGPDATVGVRHQYVRACLDLSRRVTSHLQP